MPASDPPALRLTPAQINGLRYIATGHAPHTPSPRTFGDLYQLYLVVPGRSEFGGTDWVCTEWGLAEARRRGWDV